MLCCLTFFESPNQKAKEVVEYWFKNIHGADFVCFDSWIDGYPPTSDVNLEAKKMSQTNHFGKIASDYAKYSNLPIWVSEFYGGWSPNPRFTAANHASCYEHSLLNGVAVVLLWGPENQRWNYLFTSTKNPDGGQPSPHYQVVKIFNKYFGPGAVISRTEASSPYIEALASRDNVLIINKRNENVNVKLNEKRSL